VQSVAEALDIRPFMLSRWRKEYREGKFAMKRVKKAPVDAKKKIQEQTNQQWSSDVTYIKLGEKYVFLAVVLDLYSRRLISWRLGENLNADFARATLREAFTSRKPVSDLLLHTDRGIEYRAHKTQALLNQHWVRHSMNRPGQCTDNAEVESFFKTLKGELLHATNFVTMRQLRKHIKAYIEGFYNTQRLHSGLGYRTPIEFEGIN
jgi:putative transposase